MLLHSEVSVAFQALWSTPLAKEVLRKARKAMTSTVLMEHACLSFEWRRIIGFPYCIRKYDPKHKPQGLTLGELGDAWLENALYQFIEGSEEMWLTKFPRAGKGFTTRIHAEARNNACLLDTATFLGIVRPDDHAAEHATGTLMELCFHELAWRAQDERRDDHQEARNILFLAVAAHVFIVVDKCRDLLTAEPKRRRR